MARLLKYCKMCKTRRLDNVNDPLSEDCGGDCAYCQLLIELSIGDYVTAETILLGMILRIHNITAPLKELKK